MTPSLRTAAKAILAAFAGAAMALRLAILRARPRLTIGANARVAWSSRIHTRMVDGFPRGGSVSIGDRTSVCDGAIIAAYGGTIDIGSDCFVGPYCVLYGHGGLRIGSRTLIATHTVIVTANHIYSDPGIPIAAQGERSRGVQIGDGVWIGAGAKILDGVVIGEGAVIGAGAVVTTNVPALAVAVGVPAAVVKYRDSNG